MANTNSLSESEFLAIERRMRDNAMPMTRAQDIANVNPSPVSHKRGAMNKTETVFSQFLDIQHKAGLITWWEFQPMTFKLASDCRFTPDFVTLRDGVFTMIDTKGSKRKKSDGSVTFWAEEDAKIKIRVAARQFPFFRWVICHPLPNGEWNEVVF